MNRTTLVKWMDLGGLLLLVPITWNFAQRIGPTPEQPYGGVIEVPGTPTWRAWCAVAGVLVVLAARLVDIEVDRLAARLYRKLRPVGGRD